MLSYRFGTVNEFHWWFISVVRYNIHHTQHLLEQETQCIYFLYPGYIEYEKNDREVFK